MRAGTCKQCYICFGDVLLGNFVISGPAKSTPVVENGRVKFVLKLGRLEVVGLFNGLAIAFLHCREFFKKLQLLGLSVKESLLPTQSKF